MRETRIRQETGSPQDMRKPVKMPSPRLSIPEESGLSPKQQELLVEIRKTRGPGPLGGPFAGPVTVTGRRGKRCLGAWNVVGGSSHAFIGMLDAGLVTLQWKVPGGKPRQRRITLTDTVVRCAVEPLNPAAPVRLESRQGPARLQHGERQEPTSGRRHR